METFHGGCCSTGCLLAYYTAKDKSVQMFQRNILSPSQRSLNQVQVSVEGICKLKYVNYIGRFKDCGQSELWTGKRVDTVLCTQNASLQQLWFTPPNHISSHVNLIQSPCIWKLNVRPKHWNKFIPHCTITMHVKNSRKNSIYIFIQQINLQHF